jgi:hypothetical protein
MKFKLSNQAIGALMMSLQKGIMDQADITEILKEFSLVDTVDGLMIENPPTVKVDTAEKEAAKPSA